MVSARLLELFGSMYGILAIIMNLCNRFNLINMVNMYVRFDKKVFIRRLFMIMLISYFLLSKDDKTEGLFRLWTWQPPY